MGEVFNPLLQTKCSQADFSIKKVKMEFMHANAATHALHNTMTARCLPHLTAIYQDKASTKAFPEGTYPI